MYISKKRARHSHSDVEVTLSIENVPKIHQKSGPDPHQFHPCYPHRLGTISWVAVGVQPGLPELLGAAAGLPWTLLYLGGGSTLGGPAMLMYCSTPHKNYMHVQSLQHRKTGRQFKTSLLVLFRSRTLILHA